MPTDNKWNALYWLIHQPDRKREDVKILSDMFSSEVEHSVAHVESLVQSGIVLVNDVYTSAYNQALHLLRVDWRPDLKEHLTSQLLAHDEDVRPYYVQIIAYVIHKVNYGRYAMHIPEHVNREYWNDRNYLMRKAQTLYYDVATGRLGFSAPNTKRPRLDLAGWYED